MSFIRHVTPAIRAAMEVWEAERLQAYYDSGHVLTIGFGHTGRDVTQGEKITHANADALFATDLGHAEISVQRLITKPMTDNQFGSFADMVYNVGGAAFASSSVCKHFNAGNAAQAADDLLAWNHVHGVVVDGLTKRCKWRRALFLSPLGVVPSAAH